MRREIRSLGWVESESSHSVFGPVFVFQTRDKASLTSYLTPADTKGFRCTGQESYEAWPQSANLGHANFARWGLPARACFVCIYMLRPKTSMALESMRVGVHSPAQSTWSMRVSAGCAQTGIHRPGLVRPPLLPIASEKCLAQSLPSPLVTNGLDPEVSWISLYAWALEDLIG